jgi:hypothetical protein
MRFRKNNLPLSPCRCGEGAPFRVAIELPREAQAPLLDLNALLLLLETTSSQIDCMCIHSMSSARTNNVICAGLLITNASDPIYYPTIRVPRTCMLIKTPTPRIIFADASNLLPSSRG